MRKILVVVLFLIAFSTAAYAQSTGTISGRITDPSGGVVAGATVTAINAATGIARTTVTDSSGLYNISELTPGMYNVKADVSGFAKLEKDSETLLTATTLTLNFELGLAGTASKVEVSSEAPMIELTDSVVSGTLQAAEVQNLPILNRNFSGLVTLVPSARPTATPSNNKISLGGGIGFSGGAGRNGAAEVDGVAFRDDVNGGPLYNVTLEGVQEFNVIAHDYPAQYGLTSGGIVLITTKSGGNQFHGSAFGYGRNQAMTSLDYFANPVNGGFGKAPYSREEFGGSFGGHIIKDKLFFFGAIEDVRLNQSLEIPGPIYNEAVLLKNNLMSLTSCAICVNTGNELTPSTVIPESIRDLMSSVRVDYQINSHHSLFGRWLREHTATTDDILETLGGVPHPDVNPMSSNNTDPIQGDTAMISETWVIGNNSVNTAAVSGTHFHEFQSCQCTLTGATQIYRNITFPDFQVGAPLNATNSENIQTDIQFKDTFAHQAGSHALKFGGDFILYSDLRYMRNISGDVFFFDDPDVIIGNTNGKYPQGFLTPGAMKNVVLGTENFGGSPARSGVEGGKEFSLFIQDDWKVRPGFTLNLGVHYGQFINFYDQSNQQNNRALQVLQAIGNPWGSPVHADTTAYSPRIGFAWDITGSGKNVLRGSFGIFFDESLSPNMTAIDPEAQPLLENVQSSFANSSVNSNYSTVYGGPLPGTLTPGLTNFIPGGNTTITWLEPGTSDPYNEQTHIGFTRQLTSSSVISVDYTHILGLHEWQAQLINPVESANWDPNFASFNTCGLSGKYRRLECAFEKAGLAPNTIGTVQINSSTNRSQYNEMIVHFEQRTRRLDLQASYILSYAHAFGGAIGGTATGGSPIAAEIPFQWFTPTQWGPSLTDERNRIVISSVIRLPWGIEASPVFQYGSPRPYNCLSSTDWTGSNGGDSRCIMNSAGAIIPAPTLPFPAGDTSVPVNFLRGTATYDLDARFTKVFSIGERMKLNAFVELYNLTNKANFGNNYNGTCSASKTNPTACSSSFEKPLGYLNNGYSFPISRQIQLGARFTF